jgi:hypothetical protein
MLALWAHFTINSGIAVGGGDGGGGGVECSF